jgi:RNA polymerase sigma-B factor
VRPPRGLLELSLDVERRRDPLRAALGREPTVADFAERLCRPASEVAEAIEIWAGRAARSLDSAVAREEDETVMLDLLGHEDVEYARAEARTVVERLLPALDQRARTILSLRFEHDLRQCEIATAVGLSQMHVSRLIRSSLERLTDYASALESRLQPA